MRSLERDKKWKNKSKNLDKLKELFLLVAKQITIVENMRGY